MTEHCREQGIGAEIEDSVGRWSTGWRVVSVLLCALVIAAHALRQQQPGLGAMALAVPLLLLVRQRWALAVVRLGLLFGFVAWVQVTLELVGQRRWLGEPWLRLAGILGTVALTTLATVAALSGRTARRIWWRRSRQIWPLLSFLLVFLSLVAVQLKASRPMLLAERFVPGGGWLEILILASYGALVTEKMLDPTATARWRRRIWGLFSFVFFAQLALGLAGVEPCLMRPDTLHFPIPGLIVAGPLYRGENVFMLILFGTTLLLVGPAWCSQLCYIGAWDSAAAHRRRRPGKLPGWTAKLRLGVTLAVPTAALVLRLAGVSSVVAGTVALGFGLWSVAVILLWSRRVGQMVHCTVICPLGLLAVWLGRLSPFRLTIGQGCDACGRCRQRCRYGALRPEDIARGKPGPSCTLCGDCLASCDGAWLRYRFFGLKPHSARALFIALTVAAHTVSLGLARI